MASNLTSLTQFDNGSCPFSATFIENVISREIWIFINMITIITESNGMEWLILWHELTYSKDNANEHKINPLIYLLCP